PRARSRQAVAVSAQSAASSHPTVAEPCITDLPALAAPPGSGPRREAARPALAHGGARAQRGSARTAQMPGR
ncbi:MAG: hypothetical protein ACRDP3_11915, partial [Streptomyces sp.]